MTGNKMMSAQDVANELGISKAHAYKLIREMNEELKNAGYIVVAGRIPVTYWNKKFYGLQANA